MPENILKHKTMDFAIRVVNLYQHLCKNKSEFVLSKQILRSGTSVGAMIREAEHSESKADFVHKMSIGQKEINETIYWLELLYKTNYISEAEYTSINNDAIEIIRIIAASVKTAKK